MLWIKFLTWFKGECVGQDSFGNRYYREKGVENLKERRWVIYKGIPEASKVPPEWNGWLHHLDPFPPSTETVKKWSWEKNYLPNLTGTPYAYRPPEHFLSRSKGNKATGEYEAWQPRKVKDENKSA